MVQRFRPDRRLLVARALLWFSQCLFGLWLFVLAFLANPRWEFLRWGAYLMGVMYLIAGPVGLARSLLHWYDLTPFQLVIRSGLRLRRIPLECIEGVLTTRRHGSHWRPGRPFREQVFILYREDERRRSTLLSPEDPQRFLEALAEASPFLERRGDHVVRRPGPILTA